MDAVIEAAQRRLEEKRERLGVSQQTPATGERSQPSLNTEDLAKIDRAKCLEHGYLEPEYEHNDFMEGVWVRMCPTCSKEIDAKRRKQERETAQWEKAERIGRLMGRLQIGRRFVGMTFDDYRPTCPEAEKIKSLCQRYAETFEDRYRDGDGLIFIGACGTGKNMLAAILCQEVVKQEKSAVHTTIFKLVRSVKDSWRQGSEKTEEEVINSFSLPDLLVIDEIGVQFGSETEKLYLTEIINNRYENRRPTILISNLNLGELEDVLGTRVIDRFHEGKSAILKFTWDSYRRRSDASKLQAV